MICNCNCSVLTRVALVYGPWVKSFYHTRLPNRSSVISEDQKINGLSPDFPWPSHIVVLYEYSSWYSGKYYSKYHLLCYKEFNSKEPIEGMYTVKYMEKKHRIFYTLSEEATLTGTCGKTTCSQVERIQWVMAMKESLL